MAKDEPDGDRGRGAAAAGIAGSGIFAAGSTGFYVLQTVLGKVDPTNVVAVFAVAATAIVLLFAGALMSVGAAFALLAQRSNGLAAPRGTARLEPWMTVLLSGLALGVAALIALVLVVLASTIR